MNNGLQTTHRNVLWFKKCHDAGELELSPPYQRNPVWVERQKAYLMDSILNSFPIPEIYMQDTVTAKGEAKYYVVDGQQRIRACLEFLEGKFTLDGEDSPNYADFYFEDLTDEEKKRFYDYKFVVRILPEMTGEEIRNIFQRLNRNVIALNQQELRHATYWGPFIQLMNKISNKDIWKDINIFTSNDVRRMLDVEYISELTGALLHGHQDKKKNLDSWYQMYEETFEQEEYVEDVFDAVLKEISKIFPTIKKTRWGKKTNFYSLFLVFGSHYNDLPLSREGRKECHTLLDAFGKDIDLFVSTTETNKPKFSKNVIQYSEKIRATTDLASRKSRFDALESELANIWSV